MAKAAPTKPTSKGKPDADEDKKKKGQSNLPAVQGTTQRGVVKASAQEIEEFEGDRSGFENVKTSDLIIPRLKLLQKLSPQCDKDDEKYVDGAEPGMFYDFSTGDLFEGELELIACHYVLEHLEWAPRETGKGLVMNHGASSAIMRKTTMDEKRKNWLPNGNQIIETAEYYVLNMTVGGRRSFLPLQSTGLTASRNWLTAMNNITIEKPNGDTFHPPLYYKSWIADRQLLSNESGKWYNWVFKPGKTILELDPSKELLKEARDFHEQAVEGLVKGDVGDDQEGQQSRDPSGKM